MFCLLPLVGRRAGTEVDGLELVDIEDWERGAIKGRCDRSRDEALVRSG